MKSALRQEMEADLISSEAARRRFHPSPARISSCNARFHSFWVCSRIRTNESLPPGGRGTTKWWKEPARHCNLVKLYGKALSLTRLRQEPSARVASIACFPLWLKICHRHIFLTRRALPEGAYLRETVEMFTKLWYNNVRKAV